MKKPSHIRIGEAVFSANMLVSCLVGIVLLIWSFVRNIVLYNQYIGSLPLSEWNDLYLNSILESHARSGFDLFAPILAVLPASTCYCDDRNSGYLKCILLRQNRRNYASQTYICSSFAGGLAVLIPSFVSSVFFMLIGKPNRVEDIIIENTSLMEGTVFSSIQFICGGALVVLLFLVLAFLFGALWSNIGLCISVFVPNRYVTLITPFAIYFALHILLYRTGVLLLFSPVNMLMPTAAFIPDLLFPFAYQGILLLGSFVVYHTAIKRRLSDV